MRFKNMKESSQYFSLLAIVGVMALVCSASPALAATAPTLGTAQSYGVLGATTVTNTGPTFVYGDLGVFAGSAFTGFPPGLVTGTKHAADAIALQAQNDVTTTNTALTSQACDSTSDPVDLSGSTLGPGVYCYTSSVSNTGTLTLDAGGDPDAVWVFKTVSTLVTGPGSSVVVINGGQDCNVFWQVGSSATLDTTTDFVGNIIAYDSITLNTGAKLSGRALARIGAVTMDSNVITPSICSETKALKLKKTASPGIYDTLFETISYTYELKNIGTVELSGPFTVSDDKVTVTCPGTTTLSPGETITCTASHSVTQADLDAGSITNNATATANNGGDSVTSFKDMVTILKKVIPIPEFPTVALPVIAVIGLMFLFQRRKGE